MNVGERETLPIGNELSNSSSIKYAKHNPAAVVGDDVKTDHSAAG